MRLKAEQNVVCSPGTDLEERAYNFIFVLNLYLFLFSRSNIPWTQVKKNKEYKNAVYADNYRILYKYFIH